MRRTLRMISGWALLAVASFALGFARGPESGRESGAKTLQGWQEKKTRVVRGSHAKVDQNELVAISTRLREAIGIDPLNKVTAVQPSRLRQALTRLGDKPIDLASAIERNRRLANWKVHWHQQNGTPIFITRSGRNPEMPKSPLRASASETALDFIQVNRDIFRLDDPRNELKLVEGIQDELGKRHVKFEQRYHGVPVWGHNLVVHLEPSGEVYAVNARYSPTPREVDISSAKLSAEQAVQISRETISTHTAIEELGDWAKRILSYNGPRATQYIWVDGVTQKPHLVWHVELRPNLRDLWYCFVDAQTGAILQRYNATQFDGPTTATAVDLNGVTRTIHVYQVGSTYYMIDASRPIWQTTQPDLLNDPKGALLTQDLRGKDFGSNAQIYHVTSNDNTWNDRTSVSAHYNVGQVFEYFFGTHNRKAIDDSGSTVISIIHVAQEGQPMVNAYWNAPFMAYGDGNVAYKPLAGALDVAAHEMTHGVIEHTVHLEYKFQSGALNESFADVFGAMVDRDDWLIGEDVTKTTYIPSGALRNMEDPHNGGSSLNDNGWQPAHMNEFINLTLEEDNGGVHVNSGIPNRACFLIANTIGREKAEKIYYRILAARYLNSLSEFIDLRLGAIRAAADLFGDPSAEVNAVRAAFDAVGITGDTGTGRPPDLPPVTGEEWIAVVNAEATDNSLYLVRPVIQSNEDIVQLTTTQVFTNTGNPISVSEDGSEIVFIDSDNFIRVIHPDGSGEEVISYQGIWWSIALSPKATHLAATTIYEDTTIYIFDLMDPNASKAIRLYSPTTQEGLKADVAVYADALDWDLSGQFLLYDAFNRIPQAGGGAYEYWDVHILDVANEKIFPLFPPQPEGINIGNPSFAQTNDTYFVFDYFDENRGSDFILAMDIFKGEVGVIENNGSSLGFPKYSPNDRRMVFQRIESEVRTLRQIPIAENKIQAAGPSEPYVTEGQLPTWFAIGIRTAVAEKPETVPLAYALRQNYPNPFNPVTTIPFALPKSDRVSLKVFDILGREVATLVDNQLQPGEYKVIFNAEGLSSGVYFYQLQGEGFVQTRKLLLLK